MATAKKTPKPGATTSETDSRVMRWVEILRQTKRLRELVEAAAAEGIIDDWRADNIGVDLQNIDRELHGAGVPG